jgi:hypothetical protein
MESNAVDVRAEASPTRSLAEGKPLMKVIEKGGLLLVLTVGSCLVAPPAYAGDINKNGNGTHNHNALSIRSPTHNDGVQAISNANAGGAGSSRNALCKRARFCHIRQWGGFP